MQGVEGGRERERGGEREREREGEGGGLTTQGRWSRGGKRGEHLW